VRVSIQETIYKPCKQIKKMASNALNLDKGEDRLTRVGGSAEPLVDYSVIFTT
jgi:hypothetical protein